MNAPSTDLAIVGGSIAGIATACILDLAGVRGVVIEA